MKRHLPGLIALLVASVALGVAIGNVFFGLFDQTVPPAVLTSFNKATAHAAFLTYGAGAGVVLFLWSLLAIAASRMFAKSRGGDADSAAASRAK
ncbi:MAG: hypothetical protein U0167_08825 [bacterium]